MLIICIFMNQSERPSREPEGEKSYWEYLYSPVDLSLLGIFCFFVLTVFWYWAWAVRAECFIIIYTRSCIKQIHWVHSIKKCLKLGGNTCLESQYSEGRYWGIQGHLWLHNQLKSSLVQMRLCLQKYWSLKSQSSNFHYFFFLKIKNANLSNLVTVYLQR